jgi:hypothetical protein
MLDFEFGHVQFALASAEETNAGSVLRESDCQAFPDAPPGAGDEHGRMLQ